MMIVAVVFSSLLVAAASVVRVSAFGPTTSFASKPSRIARDPKATAHRALPEKVIQLEKDVIHALTKHRSGGWLPKDSKAVAAFIKRLKEESASKPKSLVEPVQTLQQMIKEDKVLARITDECFVEAAKRETETPLESPSVKHFDEFVQLLNHIVTSVAPEFTVCKDPATGKYEPCGLIGFPINALLDWPMATSYGYVIFANELVNQQLKKILTFWTSFLTSPESTNVLIKDDFSNEPFAVGWLSDYARQHLVDVVLEASGTKVRPDATFEQIFQCDPSSQAHGYKSWDDFFTRLFRPGIRPVAEPQDLNVIVSACESAPLQNVTNVRLSDKFWLKGMPYSLQNMMDFHPLTEKFVGGTVYQAFLSALSYHRWNSPVSGTVVDAFVVDGTYYLENLHHGFKDHRPDAAAPNDSQPFLASVATRAVIFLEADSPDIGLMCFIGVGMAEVSSCEITVKTGDRVNKGDELGMFHFGGSTHCLCFRKETKLDFIRPDVVGLDAKNIAVGSYLARASS